MRSDETFESFAGEVAAALAGSGWTLRRLRNPWGATLTRPLDGHGLIAVADLLRTSFDPLESGGAITRRFDLRIGAGHEAALGLMPLVALPPRALLAMPPPDPADEARGEPVPGFTVPTGAAERSRLTVRVAALVEQRAPAVAEAFPDVAALDAAMAAGEVDGPDLDRIVLLAVTGRDRDARAALDRLSARDDRRWPERRHTRLLGRWLDAGNATVPPVEQTLLHAPPPFPHLDPAPMPSVSREFARRRAIQQAVNAVRRRVAAHTVEEVEEMYAAELATRGIVPRPSAVAWQADIIIREREPFGRLLNAVRGASVAAVSIWDGVQRFRHLFETGPDWLEPPEEATYPLAEGFAADRVVAVRPDDRAAAGIVARAHAEGRRLGPVTQVEVWFGADGDAVSVHLGAHRVGTLRGAEAEPFAEAVRVATMFDEAPRITATIFAMPGGRPPLLEVPWPATGGS